MNKLGVHALVWEKGWSHEECARAIANTAKVGFDLIEIPALDPGSIDTAFTRKRAEKAGIGATSSLGLDAETDISSNDRDKEKRGQARAANRRVSRGPRHRRDAHVRHPRIGVPEIRGADHGGGREALLRGAAARRREGGGEQHHARPRGGEPLRVQRAQHRVAGGRDVPARSARRTSRSTSTSTT